jgi:hypothetical protein
MNTEYFNFQKKPQWEGVPFREGLVTGNTDLSDPTNAETAFLYKNRDQLKGQEQQPYGYIPTRAEQYLDDDTYLRDTYTTTQTLLVMAGVSAVVLGTMLFAAPK